MPQERHQETLQLSHHYFSGAGASTAGALTIEAHQAGAKKLLQRKAGTQAQADAPGVACDHRADFK